MNMSSKHAHERGCAKEDLEMLAAMFARTVPVANKKRSCQAQQGNVMLKCYPKILPTNSTIQKSMNPNVTLLIHSYLFKGKIKHAY